MKTTRDFLVRVDVDEPLSDEKWEEVGAQIQEALNTSVFDEGAAVVYLVPTIEELHTISEEAERKRNSYFGIVMGEE